MENKSHETFKNYDQIVNDLRRKQKWIDIITYCQSVIFEITSNGNINDDLHRLTIQAYIDIALCYGIINKPKSSIRFFRKAIALSERNKIDSSDLHGIYLMLSQAQIDAGDISKAKNSLAMSIDCLVSARTKELIVLSLIEFSKIESRAGNDVVAQSLQDIAYTIRQKSR